MARIDELFETMIGRKASDLHLHEDQPPKVRVHGEILPLSDKALTQEELVAILSGVSGPQLWNKFQETGDLDFAYEWNAQSRFRTNYMKHVHGIGALFRLIPAQIRTLDDLGIPEVVKSFVTLRGGIVLVTGPTGSGKSTTFPAQWDPKLGIHVT